MNSSFSTTNPLLQIAWDSTSLGALKECPRKYYYTIVLGTVTKDQSIHLTFGLLYHAALEAYDHARAQGLPHDRARLSAVRVALTRSWNRELNKPWFSDDSYKNRYTLVRSIVWYLAQFGESDAIETVRLANGKPAVELSFRFPTSYASPDGQPFILCGHLDRLGTLNSQYYVLDRKTSKHRIDEHFIEKFSPDNQMSTYSFAGKVIYNTPIQGIIIDAVQVLVNSSRFNRGFVTRTDGQLTEWYDELGFWLAQARQFAEAAHWPMNDKSCGNYGGCPFREVCSKSPEVREQWLTNPARFIKRVWDPLQIRGEV